MFDCHDTSPTACGGVAISTYVPIFEESTPCGMPWSQRTLYSAPWVPCTVDGDPQFTLNPLNAVDLSSRGITSIAPSGLECYNLSAVGCLLGETITESSFQAILLDGNGLTAVPNMSVFSGACYVSLANNLIGGALPSNMFAGYSPTSGRPITLFVNLQSNNINGTSRGTFSGYSGGSCVAVNAQNNNFNLNAFANGTFTGLGEYHYVAVNFESSNIGGSLTIERDVCSAGHNRPNSHAI